MSLEIGTRLGPYEITGKLGAGGMGEVYRARDTRLDRSVALKVLPPEVAEDPARRSRFEHEARAAAALNHPNVVVTYDVGSEGGVFYIVSELVEGEGLDAVLQRGPLPIRKLLDIASQVAAGMSAAHAADITHRDLKPANIMITREGRAKILDFGLAKRTDREAPAETGATLTAHHTDPGMVVGTVNYMSPEQASAKPVDTRSDQFSFGVILYEMLTGRKAFERATAVETMSAIISAEAPPLENETPAPLRWTIERCLAKEPDGRYTSTQDLYRELCTLRDRLSEVSGLPGPASATPAKPKNSWLWRGALAAAAMLAIVAVAILWPSEPAAVVTPRFTPFSFEPNGQSDPVWSPDGTAVAYNMSTQGPSQVYVKRLDEPTPVRLTNLQEGAYPILWAAGGQRIYFLSGHEPAGIWSVSAVGGEPQPVEDLNLADVYGTFPVSMTADASALAVFQQAKDDPHWRLWVSAPPGAPLEEYLPNPFVPPEIYNRPILRFSPDGTKMLLFLSAKGGNQAWLIPFPAGRSEPRRVLDTLLDSGVVQFFGWMPDSRHIVVMLQTGYSEPAQLWMVDTESGARRPVIVSPNSYYQAAVSPDGRRMVFSEIHSNADIVSVDVADGSARKLIASERSERMPAWAAHADSLVYVTDRSGPMEIWLRAGGAPDRPVVTQKDFPGESNIFLGPALSPSGDRVIYSALTSGGTLQLWISSVAGGSPVRLTNQVSTEGSGSWSPDGNRFVYVMVSGDRASLAVVPTSGEAEPQVIREGVNLTEPATPVWSPDGDWILYIADGKVNLSSPDGQTTRTLDVGKVWACTFSADGKLLYGMRRDEDRWELFSVPVAGGTSRVIAEISPQFVPRVILSGGQRFSLSPDGASFVYSRNESSSNLWLMDGLDAP